MAERSKASSGSPASAASRHRTVVQPALGTGTKRIRCSGRTTVRWTTWRANGGSIRPESVRPGRASREHRVAGTAARSRSWATVPRVMTRSLVIVAGSGRSGTSLFSGILQRLGCHVPQPEVPADATNPRGFAESQWVVDFHTRLLRAARVQVSDARPAAWALTAEAGLDAAVRDELRRWLAEQFEAAPALIVKDPRLSWYLPLWRSCAEELGVAPALRHDAPPPRRGGRLQAALVRRLAGRRRPHRRLGPADALHGARDARRAARVRPLRGPARRLDARRWRDVGERLDLAVVRDAPARAMRDVHGFVDRGLSRSRAGLGRDRAAGRTAGPGRRGLGGRRAARRRGAIPRRRPGSTSCARLRRALRGGRGDRAVLDRAPPGPRAPAGAGRAGARADAPARPPRPAPLSPLACRPRGAGGSPGRSRAADAGRSPRPASSSLR